MGNPGAQAGVPVPQRQAQAGGVPFACPQGVAAYRDKPSICGGGPPQKATPTNEFLGNDFCREAVVFEGARNFVLPCHLREADPSAA
jgi:hypothetical protein